ncbi:MAG: FMN-binding negative transcriptional regulator [Paracoccaceae bacterium]
MHPNPAFRQSPMERNLNFARDRAFGVLVVVTNGVPLISHVPFLLSDDGETVDLHLVRSNPITRALSEPLEAKVAVSGPDGYVSPDWYGAFDQVPTWNYVAVHLTGVLELRPQKELRHLLDRQSAFFESRLAPKSPWTAAKMDAEALERMMRQIVPARFRVDNVQGTWKLNQNKPEDVRLRAADGVRTGIGSELESLAEIMRSPDNFE